MKKKKKKTEKINTQTYIYIKSVNQTWGNK